MFKSINTKDLPLKDLGVSILIIFIITVIVANLYNQFWGFFYAFGNVLTLIFLSWLYQDSWNTNQ